MRPAWLGWLILLALAHLSSTNVDAAQPRSPTEILANDFNLVRSGQVWINRDEERLLQRLDELPILKKRILDAENKLAEQRERNAALWNEFLTAQQFIKSLEASRENTSNGTGRKNLDRQLQVQREVIRQLQQRAVEPAKLGGHPAIRAPLIALTNDRNALLLSLLWIRATSAELDEAYRALGADPHVSRAMGQLDGDHQLGPLRNYNERLAQLAPYEKVVFRPDLPLYLTGDRLRVSLIVGEHTPATFTWQESHEPTIITSSLAEAAGIEVPRAAPRVRVTVDRERSVEAWEIVIPYLRLGRYVVRDVKAFLLPPECEDVGSQIGPLALPGHQAVAEPEALRLKIGPAGGR